MSTLLALEKAEGYVAGAYLVLVALLLVYLTIMAAKLQRIRREIADVAERAEERGAR